MDAAGSARPAAAGREGDAMDADTMVAKSFLAAFRHHPAGVAILTGDPGDGPVALTISSLISVSVEPPTIAFSLSELSASAKALAKCETVVAHFVRRTDMQLARLCATSGSARFGPGVEWGRLATGEPYYPQVETWFLAAIRGRLASPGACLMTAEFVEASPGWPDTPQGETLVYADRAWHGLRPLADPVRTPLLLWPDDSATF